MRRRRRGCRERLGRALRLGVLGLLVAVTGCRGRGVGSARPAPAERIGFDLAILNAEGLAGPPDGLVAIDYEFCIPADEARLREVRTVDPSVRVRKGSRGRIGCGAGWWLCLGNTHQPHAREILLRLAALPYIERIERVWWE